MDSENNVAALIVTFWPNIERLRLVIDSVRQQALITIVVDNGSGEETCWWLERLADAGIIQLQRLPENMGLGSAFNKGITLAKELSAKYVLLLDQDSVPQSGMVECLKQVLEQPVSDSVKLAAVGPMFIDVRTNNRSGFIKLGVLRASRQLCKESALFLADFLISSGSLIPLDTLNDVGYMDEALFIDHVDTEWCLRARGKGYKLLGVCDARLDHQLGENHARVWFGRWRNVTLYEPFRYYYVFRNSLLLYRRSYVPLRWIRFDLMRLIMFSIYFGILSSERRKWLKPVMLGVRDGLRGRSGRMP